MAKNIYRWLIEQHGIKNRAFPGGWVIQRTTQTRKEAFKIALDDFVAKKVKRGNPDEKPLKIYISRLVKANRKEKYTRLKPIPSATITVTIDRDKKGFYKG